MVCQGHQRHKNQDRRLFSRTIPPQKSPSPILIDLEISEAPESPVENDLPEDVVESSIEPSPESPDLEAADTTLEVAEISGEEAEWDPLAAEEIEVEEVLEDLTTDSGSLTSEQPAANSQEEETSEETTEITTETSSEVEPSLEVISEETESINPVAESELEEDAIDLRAESELEDDVIDPVDESKLEEDAIVAEADETDADTEPDEVTDEDQEDEDAEDTLVDIPLLLSDVVGGLGTVTDPSGQLSVIWKFDGGAYEGQVGVVSTVGLENYDLNSIEFMQEAIRRALDNIVVDDTIEGSEISGNMGDGDSNHGEFAGEKIIQLSVGEQFFFVVIPNGTFTNVLASLEAGEVPTGSLRPLFSLTVANPDSMNHFVQVVDLTGKGSTFALEDISNDQKSDWDLNDIIITVKGADLDAPTVGDLIDAGVITEAPKWMETDLGGEVIDTPNLENDEIIVPPEIIGTLPVDPLTGAEYIPGSMMLKFDSTATEAEILAFAQSQGAISVENLFEQETNGDGQWKVLQFAPDKDLVEVRAVASQESIVAGVELDYKLTANISRDSMTNSLWGLNNTGQTGGLPDADIDLPEAWRTQTGSKAITVAVIDTGGDYRHPDLAANTWRNQGEVFGNGVDDDRNGFVDDVHGYDFVNRDGDPMDDQGHGTHVAGTIGAVGNNNRGVVGVNQNVSLMHLKFLDSQGNGSTIDAIRSVDYATRMGADVINASFGGGGYSQAMFDALSRANNAGVLFVAAAGNEGNNNDFRPSFPANYDLPNVISVAATDHRDRLADLSNSNFRSNFGRNSVDLGAPGVDILSTLPGNRYGSFGGTSMATPHVAGAAALLLAENSNQTPSQLKNLLMRTTDPVTSLQGRTVTGGRLNVNRALSQITTPQNPIWRVPFSGVVGPSVGINLRYSQKFNDRSPWNEPYGKRLEFDAWTYGETGTDMWLGTPDARWFKIKGRDLWVPSCWINGNPPNSQPMPQSLSNFDVSATHGSIGDDFIAINNLTISSQTINQPGYVNYGPGINFRRGTSTSSTIISGLSNGTPLTILRSVSGSAYTGPDGKSSSQWYEVRVGRETGYVAAAFVRQGTQPSQPINQPGYVNYGPGINFRRGTSTSSTIISGLSNGTPLTILRSVSGSAYTGPDGKSSSQWYEVRVGRETGYVAAAFVRQGTISSSRYNRQAAVDYAKRYAKSRNPAYHSYEQNCANFVSQCLVAGGLFPKYTTDRVNGNYPYTTVLGLNNNLWDKNLATQVATGLLSDQSIKNHINNTLRAGDVILYDWENNGSWDHCDIYLGNSLIASNTTDRLDDNIFALRKPGTRVKLFKIND